MGGDALLLIAHGSARYPNAAAPVLTHAAAIRALGRFAAVTVGFLNGEPSVAEALAPCGDRIVHVVPFFMEDGYFTRVAVPRALGHHPGLRPHPPIGTHPGMVELIRRRIDGQRLSDLILIGHGSAKSPGRRMAIHAHAEAVGARVAFLEEPPFLPDTLAAGRGSAIGVLGMFAGDGTHVRDDLPALLAMGGDRVIDLGTIGDDPGMVELILAVTASP